MNYNVDELRNKNEKQQIKNLVIFGNLNVLLPFLQTCPNWSKLIQIGQNLSKSVKTFPNWFKLILIDQNLSKFKIVQNLSKLV